MQGTRSQIDDRSTTDNKGDQTQELMIWTGSNATQIKNWLGDGWDAWQDGATRHLILDNRRGRREVFHRPGSMIAKNPDGSLTTEDPPALLRDHRLWQAD